MIMETTTDFPWDDLEIPRRRGEFVTKLISADVNPNRHRVFWARNWRDKPALLVEYGASTWVKMTLPSPSGITVRDAPETGTLTVELEEVGKEASELFLEVCNDIVGTLQEHPIEESRQACILRLRRWSELLRPERKRLSLERQKGLIAELAFLRDDMFATRGSGAALEGWVGPEGGKRDFAFGQVLAEVKSKRDSAHHEVKVSSEDQLSTNPSERLFLCVVEVNPAPDGPEDCHEDTFTLKDAVEGAKGELTSPLQRETLEVKLALAGYFDEDDYSDCRWSRGSVSYYEVRDGFPRLRPEDLAPGVSGVKYRLDLSYCADFLVNRDVVIEAMG